MGLAVPIHFQNNQLHYFATIAIICFNSPLFTCKPNYVQDLRVLIHQSTNQKLSVYRTITLNFNFTVQSIADPNLPYRQCSQLTTYVFFLQLMYYFIQDAHHICFYLIILNEGFGQVRLVLCTASQRSTGAISELLSQPTLLESTPDHAYNDLRVPLGNRLDNTIKLFINLSLHHSTKKYYYITTNLLT